jgi:hypothetical protein
VPRDIERNPDGTPKPGQSLRKATLVRDGKGLSKRVIRLMKKKHGSALKVFEWAMEIAAKEGAKDRMKAIEFLANRMFGKPLQTHEITGKDGGPVATSPFAGMTPEQLLLIVKGSASGSGGTSGPGAP